MDSDATVFGTPVSQIQTGLAVTGEAGADGTIAGTSLWLADGDIADYWGSGNFMALAFSTQDEGVTIRVGMDPSQGSGLVPLDEDMNGVFKITDNTGQVFKVIEEDADGHRLEQTFTLSGVELSPEPTPPAPLTPAYVSIGGDEPALSPVSVARTVGSTAGDGFLYATYDPQAPAVELQIGTVSSSDPTVVAVTGSAGDYEFSCDFLAAGTATVTVTDQTGQYEAVVTFTVTAPTVVVDPSGR